MHVMKIRIYYIYIYILFYFLTRNRFGLGRWHDSDVGIHLYGKQLIAINIAGVANIYLL